MPERVPPRRLGYAAASRAFLLAGLAALAVADLAVSALDPWAELARLLAGVLRPDALAVTATGVVLTVAFAVLGVLAGAACGFALALAFGRSRAVRVFCAAIRSMHELFWALLLIQVTGLSPTTGLLAITIPLRSTLVLGFIGLPTMGFELESYFRQGQYAQAAALVGVFYLLIGTRRLWARPATRPFLGAGSVAALAWLITPIGGDSPWTALARFLGHDIVPRPLRGTDLSDPASWAVLGAWLWPILRHQVVPGLVNTLVLSQIALIGMGLLAPLLFPLACARFAGRLGQGAGRALLVVARSTPEYVLAYVLLQLLGPSVLPAVVALALHNGGIVGYLLGRHADALAYRADAPRGADLYFYETVPRLYGQFLAYALYGGRSSCARAPYSASWASARSASTWTAPSPSCGWTWRWS